MYVKWYSLCFFPHAIHIITDKENRVGLRGHVCLTPILQIIVSEQPYFVQKTDCALFYIIKLQVVFDDLSIYCREWELELNTERLIKNS